MPPDPWPFDQPRNCAVFTVRSIAEGAPILRITHDLDDHGWQFLTLATPRSEDAVVLAFEEIVAMDASVTLLADLPPGWFAWRESPQHEWQREPNHTQTVGTDQWEVVLPGDWMRPEPRSDEQVYFESPNRSEGVYFIAVQTKNQPLRAAFQDMRVIEFRNLPPSEEGTWEVLSSTEEVRGAEVDAVTEYYNRTDNYRIVSRLLGREDFYVRLTYHDYYCTDPAVSARQSFHLLNSLTLLPETDA